MFSEAGGRARGRCAGSSRAEAPWITTSRRTRGWNDPVSATERLDPARTALLFFAGRGQSQAIHAARLPAHGARAHGRAGPAHAGGLTPAGWISRAFARALPVVMRVGHVD